MLISIVFIKSNYRQLLLAAGESEREHTPCELCVISPVGYRWSELRSSTVILQVHHSAPATGLQSSRFASCQELKARFCGHPSLTTFCFTRYGSPSLKACMDTNALKSIAFPHHFHKAYWWKSHQWPTLAALHKYSPGWLEVLTLYRRPYTGHGILPILGKCR